MPSPIQYVRLMKYHRTALHVAVLAPERRRQTHDPPVGPELHERGMPVSESAHWGPCEVGRQLCLTACRSPDERTTALGAS
jgi:hypothetical protein